MTALSILGAKLAELEAKLPGIVERLGVNPQLQKLFHLSVYGPDGQAVGEHLTPQVIERLSNAPVVLRRKSLTDLLANGDLQTVHTSNSTGAAAGPKRSIAVRSEVEPSIFGGHPVFGHVSEDPTLPAKQPLTLGYPDSGAIIKPSAMISQYGRYGFVPRDKSKLTYTFGDSLDQSKWHVLSDLIGQPDYYGPHQENSAIGALTDHFKAMKAQRAEELGIQRGNDGWWHAKPQDRTGWTDAQRREANAKEYELMDQFRDEFPDFDGLINHYGYHGIPSGGHSGRQYESYSRLIPRRFGEQGPPMSPFEESHIPELHKLIDGNPGFGYVEVQGHGLNTGDIGKVYDYGINPSTATEKKLKNLGIEYEPVSGPDSVLGQIKAFTKTKSSRPELADFLDSMGKIDDHRGDSIADSIRNWKTDPMDLPKVADHYYHGGKV